MAVGKFLNDGTITTLGVGSLDLTNDRFLAHDASATAVVQITAGDVIKRTLSGADVSWMSAFANLAAVDSSADKFALWDASASAWKLLSATEIMDRLLTTLDITSLSTMTSIGSIDPDADKLMLWDDSASAFVVLSAHEMVRRLWRGPGYDITTTPTTLTSVDSGKHYSNKGASVAITFNLPAATNGLRYSFVRNADYAMVLDPNGSETINGATTYTISAMGRVDIECFTAGEWVITQDSSIGNAVRITQEDFTAGDTLTAAESGKTCTNIGASATVTLVAPAAVAGMVFTLVRSANYALRFDPSGSEVIRGGSAGKYLELQGYGAVTLRCLTAGVWEIWQDAAPWNFEP